MGYEKDTTFKYIGKEHLKILFELANLTEDIDLENMKEVTEELGTLKITSLRPDFIGKSQKAIVMMEYESSYIGTKTKKRFHAYLALYDYYKNHENLDIYFIVITTRQKSGIVTYDINGTDHFQMLVVNIRDFDFDKIINTAKYKIENNKVFTEDEVVKLALTSIMPETREEIIKQFYVLCRMLNQIRFENQKAKESFAGITLLLSKMYFDEDDEIRKKIQRAFMNSIDPIAEAIEDGINERIDDWKIEGREDASIEVGIKLLNNDNPIEEVAKLVEIPADQLQKAYDEQKTEIKL